MRSSKSTHALVLGVAIGLAVAILPSSCGPSRPIARCNASNCDGCCDDTGSCFAGISTEACGAAGQSCSVCTAGQQCSKVDVNSNFGGRCTGGSATGGGNGNTDGGTGGGSATGGGGGSTGGGSGNTDGGTCGPANCPNGCCSATGVCITNTTPSRCGVGGNACTSCMMGNTCVSGACTPCTGCIDINTGACQGGMSNDKCGKMGGFCQTCDQAAGQTCNGGTCFGGTTCNASTCAGCCNGNNCVLPAAQMTNQCGQGAAGAACVGCFNGATCDTDAGACVGGGGTGGGGGGFPGLDGGFGTGCASSAECAATECCDSIGAAGLGTCVAAGDDCVFGGSNTTVCLALSIFGGSCSCKGSTQTCEP